VPGPRLVVVEPLISSCAVFGGHATTVVPRVVEVVKVVVP
jgi:hypothetical protein